MSGTELAYGAMRSAVLSEGCKIDLPALTEKDKVRRARRRRGEERKRRREGTGREEERRRG
eukprot:3106084-Rhodomonas_salina.1